VVKTDTLMNVTINADMTSLYSEKIIQIVKYNIIMWETTHKSKRKQPRQHF